MATQELEPVYLINGSDRPKVEYAVRRLRNRFDATATDVVSAIDTDAATVVSLCNAGTLFGDGRLVVVQEVDGRRDSSNRLAKGWKASEIEAIASYLSAPAPGTVLCLVTEEQKKDAPLSKVCAKAGQILDFAVVKKNLTGWVAERFRQLGVIAEAEACGALLHIVGEEDLHALASEIDKIAVWADGEPVGALEIERLATPLANVPGWALTDAWARRDRAGALEAVEIMCDRSDRPRRDESARIAGALGAHLVRLKQMKAAAAEGSRKGREVAGKLKLNPFHADKLFVQAEGFSADELRDATVVLASLDQALKGGSRLAPELELQLAVTALVREPGRS